METKIWVYNTSHNIKPTDIIGTTRRLHSFCFANCIRDCLLKSQGGWYYLHRDGTLELVNRCLGNITFDQFFKLAKLHG